jgi:hypothetical protein
MEAPDTPEGACKEAAMEMYRQLVAKGVASITGIGVGWSDPYQEQVIIKIYVSDVFETLLIPTEFDGYDVVIESTSHDLVVETQPQEIEKEYICDCCNEQPDKCVCEIDEPFYCNGCGEPKYKCYCDNICKYCGRTEYECSGLSDSGECPMNFSTKLINTSEKQ